jgi:cobalamin biosynthesis Mg chelatase CobN
MPHCSECGEWLSEDSKYCSECGAEVGSSTSSNSSSSSNSGIDPEDYGTSGVKTSRGSSSRRRNNRSTERSSNDRKTVRKSELQGSAYDSSYDWFKYCKITTLVSLVLGGAAGGIIGANSYVPGQGYNFQQAIASASPLLVMAYYIGSLLGIVAIATMVIDVYEMNKNDVWDRSPVIWLVGGIFLSIFVLLYYIYIRRQYE